MISEQDTRGSSTAFPQLACVCCSADPQLSGATVLHSNNTSVIACCKISSTGPRHKSRTKYVTGHVLRQHPRARTTPRSCTSAGALGTSAKALRRRLFEAAYAPCRCPSASPASAACPDPPRRAPRPIAGAAPSPADPGAGVALVSGTTAMSRRCQLRTCTRAPDYLNVHKVGAICAAQQAARSSCCAKAL